MTLPGSREHVTLPPLENDRIGSSFSGRLVYYPKPLPYPEKLPLTRVVCMMLLISRESSSSDVKFADTCKIAKVLAHMFSCSVQILINFRK